MRRLTITLLFCIATAACSAGQVPDLPEATVRVPSSSPATSTTLSITTTTEPLFIPEALSDFATRSLTIEDGEFIYSLTVAVADTDQKRSQGLMGITDLGDLDGMLFIWPESTTSTFWMKDTLIPLDIAFFAADGALVDNFTMVPCPDDDCPDYSATAVYKYAIEVPESGFSDLTASARLDL